MCDAENPLGHSVLKAILITSAVVAVLSAGMQSMQAQTFSVVHSFTGGADGGNPRAGLISDNAGNFYGTAFDGGQFNGGVVFKETHSGTGWILSPLYTFSGYSNGAAPDAVALRDGILFGTTYHGGGSGDNGTVFELQQPANVCRSTFCPWTESLLHRFLGGPDGSVPIGGVVFDQAGNLYGATQYGGGHESPGTIYELMPSDGGWAENVLYRFSGGADGSYINGVIFGPDGNLYGTALYGGENNNGTVFELMNTGSGWALKVLHTFQGGDDGFNPAGGLIFDQAGNIYGTTAAGGPDFGGTVFKLTPSGGSWTLSSVYGFSGLEECGPYASLSMDAAGNLYGTTYCDGVDQYGTAFKLTPSNGSWTYTSLHDFTGGSDGGYPYSSVILDASGNAYGTTLQGGSTGNGNCITTCGVLWKIAP
jgi:uncharacterized repeat protein (TIGR03803 family)